MTSDPNLFVRAFIFACRNKGYWPFGFDKEPPIGSIMLDSEVVAPFTYRALAIETNYFSANRVIQQAAKWLRSYSLEQQERAGTLLEAWYNSFGDVSHGPVHYRTTSSEDRADVWGNI